jgi:hypothetical protein
LIRRASNLDAVVYLILRELLDRCSPRQTALLLQTATPPGLRELLDRRPPLQSWTVAARRMTTSESKEDDQKDGARRPAGVGRRDEDAEKYTEKDGKEGAKRSRAGAGGSPRPGAGRHEASARGDELCRDGGASSWPWCKRDRVYERQSI